MGAHCPHCDMFSSDDARCEHCGEPIPHDSPAGPGPGRVADPVRVPAGFGGGWMKWILVFAGVVVLALIGYRWLAAPAGSGPIPDYMNEGPVNLVSLVEPGKLNIVDMYSEYCPPCRQIAPYLEKLDHARDDIHVVKVDINRPEVKGIDWQGPVARQFKLRSIPHFIIIGPDGQIQDQGKPAYKRVIKLIQEMEEQ